MQNFFNANPCRPPATGSVCNFKPLLALIRRRRFTHWAEMRANDERSDISKLKLTRLRIESLG
jgi:hypothetical protein